MESLRTAQVGGRIRFKEEKQAYTIQARNDRYLVCTKPFNPKRTVIYTIVDLKHGVRAPDNMLFCMGYETRNECEDNLEELTNGTNGMELSYRRKIKVNVDAVIPAKQ